LIAGGIPGGRRTTANRSTQIAREDESEDERARPQKVPAGRDDPGSDIEGGRAEAVS